MPFFWDWVWEKLSGVSKTATESKSLGGPEVDNQVREEVVRNRRAVPAKKSNTSAKSAGVRSNNTSKASLKIPWTTVRAETQKIKRKIKTV